MSNRPLGRRVPTDFTHVDRYPLTAAETPPKPIPVVIGVNWYSAFDKPEQDSKGHWWVARSGLVGRLRGGHCVCLKARGARDSVKRQVYYDQGSEGACVGFGISRMMTHLNGGKLYDARWIYREAQKVDEWPGEAYEGTSVRAGLDVLRERGHRVFDGGVVRPESLDEGIAANRWIRSIEDCLTVLGYLNVPYVDILNSWGKSYPLLTRMPVKVLEKLWNEDGEIAVITDR
jgi:hypothetical protein